MTLDLIIQAAEFIEYVEATKARGGVPVDSSTYYWNILYVPLQDSVVDLNSSCDSRVLVKSHKSSSCEKSNIKMNERSNLRKNHNTLEKKRRAVVKQRVEDLRKILPSVKHRKVSIVCILKNAEVEVQSLKSQCNALEKESNILMDEKMRLQNTLEQLKMENRGRNNHHLNSVNDYSDGECTSTASEGDDHSDEEVVDQIMEAEVIHDETKDHHMAGAEKQCAVLHCNGINASDKVTTHPERRSLVLAGLSEESNNIVKKNTVPFSCDKSSESKVDLCSPKSASQPHEQISVKDNKCKLNSKCVSEHSNEIKPVPENSAKILMNSSKTGLGPLSRTLQQILNSPLESRTVIRSGGDSLLKSVSAPANVCVAFRSTIAASRTNNCAQGTLLYPVMVKVSL